MPDTGVIKDDAARSDQGSARASDYFALLKPRVMSLVVFTGLVGMAVAPGNLHPVLAFTALLCIAVGAGASGAINMWYDADIDLVMERTKNRPVPSGKVTAQEALGIGASLSVASVLLMGLAVNMVAAGLLAMTIGFYVFIYTMWLKRRTPQNIVIGGAAGAFPPMIGWAAVSGDVGIESLVLFAIIFFWTPPHFWALSLWRDIDYAKAGVPMLPVVAGREATRRQMMVYSVLLWPIGVTPYFLGFAGPAFGIGSAILGAIFLLGTTKVWLKKDETSAKQLFAFSILYLFLIFALLLGEVIANKAV
ncbi:MAG: protoheme IX farnesyltransferase [Sneathiella sp.]|nr:protoheme IX farnesyltransferase [Sneathiella sp.]